VYQFIRDHGGFENWQVVSIENVVDCLNSDMLRARERYWIETLQSELNKQVPTRTTKQWYEDNREYQLNKMKEWYDLNHEHMLIKMKEYYNINRDKKLKYQKEYAELNRDKKAIYQKEYAELNRDKKAIYKKEWYQLNKDIIKEKYRERIARQKLNTLGIDNKKQLKELLSLF
jgi:hypothetical protein